jgi:hypothetical protein
MIDHVDGDGKHISMAYNLAMDLYTIDIVFVQATS